MEGGASSVTVEESYFHEGRFTWGPKRHANPVLFEGRRSGSSYGVGVSSPGTDGEGGRGRVE